MPTIYYLGFADEEFNKSTVRVSTIMKKANVEGGWTDRKKCEFKASSDMEQVNAVLHIVSEQEMNRLYPSMKGFSVTDWSESPPRIYFNLDNIQSPPKSYTGTKDEYLTYIVQHELGHAIFKIMHHDKEDKRHPTTKVCSIMYQQTRGTGNCTPGHSFY
jgi:hypothetical protein